jgi:hypothetical protein
MLADLVLKLLGQQVVILQFTIYYTGVIIYFTKRTLTRLPKHALIKWTAYGLLTITLVTPHLIYLQSAHSEHFQC